MEYIIAFEIKHKAENDHEAQQAALNMGLNERKEHDNDCQITGIFKHISGNKYEAIDLDKLESNLNPVFEQLTNPFNPNKT